jgi:hypothetical protein
MGQKSRNVDRSSVPFFCFLGRNNQRVRKWKNGTEVVVWTAFLEKMPEEGDA